MNRCIYLHKVKSDALRVIAAQVPFCPGTWVGSTEEFRSITSSFQNGKTSPPPLSHTHKNPKLSKKCGIPSVKVAQHEKNP